MLTRLGIVDYGLGNVHSVQHALTEAGAEVSVVRTPDELEHAAALVLPGVGTFEAGMRGLDTSGLRQPLMAAAAAGKPLLGICLGMQLLAEAGLEDGHHTGLGLIPGVVTRLTPEPGGGRVPHIGWDELELTGDSPLWRRVRQPVTVYFVHSYALAWTDEEAVLARCASPSPFVAAVQRDNVVGVQFHPEKSQTVGLRILRNFLGMFG